MELERVKLELLSAQEEAGIETELLEEEIEVLKSKEKMMMTILRKAGLAPSLDVDGDGEVSLQEGEAYLAGASEAT